MKATVKESVKIETTLIKTCSVGLKICGERNVLALFAETFAWALNLQGVTQTVQRVHGQNSIHFFELHFPFLTPNLEPIFEDFAIIHIFSSLPNFSVVFRF